MEMITLTLLILSLFFIFSGLYILFNGEKRHERFEVALTDLASSIWLKYNEGYEEVKEEKEKVDLYSREDVETEDTCLPDRQGGQKTEGSTEKTEDIVPEPLKSFLSDCIIPYKKQIDMQGVADVAKELINLMETHGSCPSVIIGTRDTESIDLITVRDNLAQVSLKEHTYTVTRKLISLIKETYMDYENLIPKALITGLAHDIGKIPALRDSGLYNTSEHPLISANKLAELFSQKDVFWSRDAARAVKEHHIFSEDQFTRLLKEADRSAREIELIRFIKDYEIKPFDTWFDTNKFMDLLDPHINMTKNEKYQVFSFKGIIYSRPDFLYDLTKKLLREIKVIDLTFVYDSEKEHALRLIVNALRTSGVIPDALQKNYYVRRFEMKTYTGRKSRAMFTPIKMDERFDITKIELRKMGFLETIEAMYPV